MSTQNVTTVQNINCSLAFNRGALCHITRFFLFTIGAGGAAAIGCSVAQYYLPFWGVYAGAADIAVASVLFAITFIRITTEEPSKPCIDEKLASIFAGTEHNIRYKQNIQPVEKEELPQGEPRRVIIVEASVDGGKPVWNTEVMNQDVSYTLGEDAKETTYYVPVLDNYSDDFKRRYEKLKSDGASPEAFEELFNSTDVYVSYASKALQDGTRTVKLMKLNAEGQWVEESLEVKTERMPDKDKKFVHITGEHKGLSTLLRLQMLTKAGGLKSSEPDNEAWKTACKDAGIKYYDERNAKKTYEEVVAFQKHASNRSYTTTALTKGPYKHAAVGERYIAYSVPNRGDNDNEDRCIVIYDLLTMKPVGKKIKLASINSMFIDESNQNSPVLCVTYERDNKRVAYSIPDGAETTFPTISYEEGGERKEKPKDPYKLDREPKPILSNDGKRYVIRSEDLDNFDIKDVDGLRAFNYSVKTAKGKGLCGDIRGETLVCGHEGGSITVHDLRSTKRFPIPLKEEIRIHKSDPTLVRLRHHKVVVAYEEGLYVLDFLGKKSAF